MKSLSCLPRLSTFLVLTGAFACASMLAGCGLKGPLYMPDPDAAPQGSSKSSATKKDSNTMTPASPVYVPPASR